MTTPIGCRMFLYNTVCEIVLYRWKGDGGLLLEGCRRIARDVQDMLNLYDPDSELARMNRLYMPKRAYPVSEPLFRLLRELQDFTLCSGGAFDPATGPLTRLWDVAGEHPREPGPGAVARARALTGFHRAVLDPEARTVTLPEAGMIIDAGGAGKGYAAGLAEQYLRENGALSASIDFGGNLCVIGPCHPPEGPPRGWRIGVQSPWRPRGESLGFLELRDLSAATSGGYDRYFSRGGRALHHLLDPRTGRPAESGLQGITVVSNVPLMTDLLSTAFFVAGLREGDALLRKLPDHVTAEYIAVTDDGIVVSPGLENRFTPVGAEAVVCGKENPE